MLTLYVIRSMEQLLPFFNLLSQVFSSKASSRSGPAYAHNRTDASFPSHKEGHKLESQKVFWSRARQNIEEMVEKDFLEGLIKTWGQNKRRERELTHNWSTLVNLNLYIKKTIWDYKLGEEFVHSFFFFFFIMIFLLKATLLILIICIYGAALMNFNISCESFRIKWKCCAIPYRCDLIKISNEKFTSAMLFSF